MEKEEFVPEYVYDIFKSLFENNLRPNCVRTKNITNEGLNQLIAKEIFKNDKCCLLLTSP